MSQIPLNNYENRNFQLWEYNVSHGQVLIRSPRAQDDENIDLIFAGVEFLSVPRHIKGLSIEPATNVEIQYICEQLGKPVEASKVTVLSSSDRRYFVVSAGMKIKTNEGDIFDSPFN